MFTTAEPASAAVDPAETASPATSKILPTPAVLELDAIFMAELDLIHQTACAYADLGRRLYALPGLQYERFTVDAEISRELIRRYIDRTKELAIRHLSCETAPFDPSTDDLFEDEWEAWAEQYRRSQAHVCVRDLAKAFRPLNAWALIVAQHDHDALERAAARADARKIAGYFGILRDYGRQNQEMKIVRGRVEVAIRVYVEKNYRGEAQMRSDSLGDLGQAIAATLARADRSPAIGYNLTALGRQLRNEAVVSRKRVDLGEGADIVQGFENFKLHLPMEVATALNVAIAEHREAWDS